MADSIEKNDNLGHCDELEQNLNIRIPCRLAQRIEAYAKQRKMELSTVVIEALDSFLLG